MTRSKSEKFVNISHLRRLEWLEKAWNAAKCKHGKWVCTIIVRIVCTLFKQLHCVYVCSLTASCVPRENEKGSKYLCSLNINWNFNTGWCFIYRWKLGLKVFNRKGVILSIIWQNRQWLNHIIKFTIRRNIKNIHSIYHWFFRLALFPRPSDFASFCVEKRKAFETKLYLV